MINYYKVLGIDKKATKEQIKKMYKIQAMKTHPDKGGDKEQFQRVAQAYEILSDEDKRREYDHRFEYRIFIPYLFPRNEVWLTLEQILKGSNVEVVIKLHEFFGEDGESVSFSESVRKCPMHLSFNCPTCRGNNFLVDSAVRKVEITKQKTITVNPRHGIFHNKKEQIEDFFVIYKIHPHSNYKIINTHNLYIEKSINVFHALLGNSIELPTLEKRIVVEFTEPIHEKEYRIRFRGLWSGSTTRGDIICKINFIMPELKKELKESLRQAYNHLVEDAVDYSQEEKHIFKET